MFKGNQQCRVYDPPRSNAYGQKVPSTTSRSTKCSIVKLMRMVEKSSVRTDTSGTKGGADEVIADCKVLMSPLESIDLDSLVEVYGVRFRVTAINPQFDTKGRIHHIEVMGASVK